MKILIVSDTHGDSDRLMNVFLREQDADIYLHAGDIEDNKDNIAPFAGVRGNCDGFYSSFYPSCRIVPTPFGKLYVEHHPIYEENRLRSLYEDGVRIFIHGHTHKKEAKIEGGIHIFCPGSLSYPREEGNGWYLVLEISEKEVRPYFKEY